MNVIEYLQTNLEPVYRFYAGHIPILTTHDMNTPFILNGKVYCTGFINIGKNWYKIVVDESMDGAITYGLRNYISIRATHPEIYTIIRRIQDKLMLSMIANLESTSTKTELVQLRIVTNMIMNLTYLDSDIRLDWTNWIRDLYWKRKAAVHQYIINYVLPF